MKTSKKDRLASGEGVKDLKKKHHCFCWLWRFHEGEEATELLDGGGERKFIVKSFDCGDCGNTGWCY